MNGRVAPVTRDNFQDLFIVIEEKVAGTARVGRKGSLEYGHVFSVSHYQDSSACFAILC